MAGGRGDCPACGAPVDDAWCAACGLELGGEEADALRDLSSQLAAAEADLNVVWARRDDLARRLASRRMQWVNVASGPPFPPAPSPVRPSPAPSVGEWNVERIRNVLLWLGATLLALGGANFTSWPFSFRKMKWLASVEVKSMSPTTIRPPGRAVRTSRSNTAERSGTCRSTSRVWTRSKQSSGSGSVRMSCRWTVRLGTLIWANNSVSRSVARTEPVSPTRSHNHRVMEPAPAPTSRHRQPDATPTPTRCRIVCGS